MVLNAEYFCATEFCIHMKSKSSSGLLTSASLTGSQKLTARVPDANGKARGVALCDDEGAAEEMLVAMKQPS